MMEIFVNIFNSNLYKTIHSDKAKLSKFTPKYSIS